MFKFFKRQNSDTSQKRQSTCVFHNLRSPFSLSEAIQKNPKLAQLMEKIDPKEKEFWNQEKKNALSFEQYGALRQQVVSLLSKALALVQLPELYSRRGKILAFRAHNSDELKGKRDFEMALQLDPEYAPALIELAKHYLYYGGYKYFLSNEDGGHSETAESKLAVSFLEKAAALLPKFPNSTDSFLETVGVDLRLIELAVYHLPNEAKLHLELANLYAIRGNVEKAKEHAAKSIDLDPTNEDAILLKESLRLGIAVQKDQQTNIELISKERYYSDVITLKSQLKKPAPPDIYELGYAYRNRAETRIEMGNPDGALEDVQELINRFPEQDYYALLAEVQCARGEFAPALIAANQAIDSFYFNSSVLRPLFGELSLEELGKTRKRYSTEEIVLMLTDTGFHQTWKEADLSIVWNTPRSDLVDLFRFRASIKNVLGDFSGSKSDDDFAQHLDDKGINPGIDW